MWEVDLPQKVGPQEKKGVFLSFMQGSSYESGFALGSTLIAGGLQATWGPVGPPKAIYVRDTDCIMSRSTNKT